MSEITQLKQQIELEYLAAKWGLSGLAYGTARHPQITARMERMGASFTKLTHLVGSPEQATQIMADVLEQVPEQATRLHLLEVLRYELGHSEATEILLDHIQELWETMDLLCERFGLELSQKIINTPSYIPEGNQMRSGSHYD